MTNAQAERDALYAIAQVIHARDGVVFGRLPNGLPCDCQYCHKAREGEKQFPIGRPT